ncbi:Zinc/iron permease [Geopyxis carbonaria]|nr:Zinc/iron permease [Geopyxis carbonaria]
MNCPTRDPEPTGNPGFNQSPPAFDKALYPRSSSVCGGGNLRADEYNVGLHIMALFVVLAQSFAACAFPLVAKRFPKLRIPPSFLFFARHFGTGVLIATAFVHLLPTAFISLTDPCLPEFWNKTYPAMAGAIAMCAVFLVTTVEMIFTRGLCKGNYNPDAHRQATLEAGHTGEEKEGWGDADGDEEAIEDDDAPVPGSASQESVAGSEHIGGRGGMGRLGFGMAGRRRSRSHSYGQGLQKFTETLARSRSNNDAGTQAGNDTIHVIESGDATPVNASCNDTSTNTQITGAGALMSEKQTQQPMKYGLQPNGKVTLTPEQAHKKAMLQCFLLELGILFHSVFIGMALSVTVGSPFIVLLIAIVFHQTFEGLALGSRIAVLKWKDDAWQPWLMALAYGLTTPLGQAIGLGTHTLYAPTSETGLLMVGIMNAISSGLLVFAGLVELLAEDFLSDESWLTLKGRRRLLACGFVFAGAFGMAFVGAFA